MNAIKVNRRRVLTIAAALICVGGIDVLRAAVAGRLGMGRQDRN